MGSEMCIRDRLSGITKREEVEQYPYRPNIILDSVADLNELI